MHQRTENTRTRAPQGRWLCAAVLLLPVALLLCGRQWARSSWVGVWPYRVGALGQLAGLGPCATLQGDTVILHLRPGGCGPFVPAVRVPDDIPSGEPTLRLPRYPGAIATDPPHVDAAVVPPGRVPEGRQRRAAGPDGRPPRRSPTGTPLG